jgi:membrane protein YdbS with pleckstrin-like domain
MSTSQDDPAAAPGSGPAGAPAGNRPASEGQTGAEHFQAARAARRAGGDQEIDLWEGDYSAKAMAGTWFLAGLVTIAAIVAGFILRFDGTAWLIVGGVILALWVVVLLVLLYKQYSVHYRLTNQRFIHERGLLRRVTDRIEVIDMDDISFSQGPVERMLNVGTVTITSSDRTHPEIVLPGIENVRDVSTLMDDARRNERRRRGLHIETV